MTSRLLETNRVNSLNHRNRKTVERVIVIGALLAAIASLLLVSQLYDVYLEKVYPKSKMYGTWVEQDVAAYSRESFVLSAAGVTVNGGVIDTHFSWDGSYLEYQVGDNTRRFKVLDEQLTQIQLVSQPHYQPIYRLSEK
ncbi:DUF2850 domain-containing protein [Vibrio sp. JPW-9-11-11]|uniref:DUF2850 domain-containing protein n=1 Tax=Vibrio sp. JPW-9-11-11 TaxID=1416532 RepID=UPI0015930947|nr:DUF2850 domain-containing protein [Vibrio sp. JPW-9-11-11]NVD05989.1 DUF2850 domain-containing protein [Vibrio sp. JPW-9-11-11]